MYRIRVTRPDGSRATFLESFKTLCDAMSRAKELHRFWAEYGYSHEVVRKDGKVYEVAV